MIFKILEYLLLNKEQKSLSKHLKGRKTRCKIGTNGYILEEIKNENNR